MTSRSPRRILLQSRLSPRVKLSYLVFPYANFSVGGWGERTSFEFGPFAVWPDTDDNWRRFLKFPRPAKHLSMYLGRDGRPLTTLWITTFTSSQKIGQDRWQRLAAALFYTAWARIPFHTIDRPAAEDFYFEAFSLPEGAEDDSSGHVRWSKYGAAYWNRMTIHPSPEVSLSGTQLDLPKSSEPTSPYYDPTPARLFTALSQALHRHDSRALTALWFFMEACYRSAFRSSFAEDIQNICTAFEALLSVRRRGDSSKQVSSQLQAIFKAQAATPIERATSQRPSKERKEVLQRLDKWVQALYAVRNAYTHGNEVSDYLFGERSIWQDAFEIFRLAANRVILKSPERHPPNGSALEKRLMSVPYFDLVASFFNKKGDWMIPGRKSKQCVRALKEAVRQARTLDPELVESVSSVKVLRQALFNICSAIHKLLDRRNFGRRPDRAELDALNEAMGTAYADSRDAQGKLNTDVYLRRVAPRLRLSMSGLPFAGKSVRLYEIVSSFNSLLTIYGNFTAPILNSLAAMNPKSD